MKILTITVPAYNVQKYLEKCLDSFVVEQIIDNIEVIIVNDGSTDNTESIAKKYQLNYPGTFRLINKENGGHGSTINKGIEQANGKYFKVVDGDDWVDKSSLIKLVETLKRSDSDLVATNYCIIGEKDHSITRKEACSEINYNILYSFNEISKSCFIPMQSFNIKTDILKRNSISIDENMFYVDMEFILFPVPYIETIEFLDTYLYMYRVGVTTQSISSKGWYKNRNNHADVTLKLVDFYRKNEDNNLCVEKLNYISKNVIKMVRAHYRVYTRFSINSNGLQDELKNFDRNLLNTSTNIVQATNKDIIVWLLRASNFTMLKPLQVIRLMHYYIKGVINR